MTPHRMKSFNDQLNITLRLLFPQWIDNHTFNNMKVEWYSTLLHWQAITVDDFQEAMRICEKELKYE